jgi:hypothetical protein
MAYTTVALQDKIMEMYPEIGEHHLLPAVEFDAEKNAYLITVKRGKEALTTRLEKKDADECMNGLTCVYLGVQIGQFIRNFDEREAFGRDAA